MRAEIDPDACFSFANEIGGVFMVCVRCGLSEHFDGCEMADIPSDAGWDVLLEHECSGKRVLP